MRRYGFKSSPVQAKGTHTFAALVSKAGLDSVPVSADNRALVVEVWDQGDEGSCTGHGTGQGIRCALVRAGKIPTAPSRQGLYWMGRLEDGDPGDDAGSNISSILAATKLLGIPPESAWTYQAGDLVPGNRAWELLHAAADQRYVSGYARIASAGSQRQADVKVAIAAGFTVVFGTEVDQAFEDLAPGQYWPGVKGAVLGGHCMLAVGYDAEGVTVCNSWGLSWCDNGFCKMTWSAVSGFDDLWILSAAPEFT